MIIFANAKINLSLDVCRRRDDGYHEVSMIMQEVSLCDKLEIEQCEGEGIELECNSLVCDEGNIAYRAAALFYSHTGIKKLCRIKLEKNIPVCAGLGGGSSDAAAVLKALNELNSFPIPKSEICKLALKLGADVPFFIGGGTALAEGIGEKLTPLLCPEKKWVAIVKPDIDISTPLAYREIDSKPTVHPDTKGACRSLEAGDYELMYKYCGNSFEQVCEDKYPEIGIIKKHMMDYGAEFAMMSGSGPTVFGIFGSEQEAKKAFETYEGSFQGGSVARFV